MKIVMKREVAIASFIVLQIVLGRGGKRVPPLPPLKPMIRLSKKVENIRKREGLFLSLIVSPNIFL